MYTIPWVSNVIIFIYFIIYPTFPHFDNDEIMTVMLISMLICFASSLVLLIVFWSPVKTTERLILSLNLLANFGSYAVFLIGGFGSARGFILLATAVSILIVAYSLKIAINVTRRNHQ